MADLVKVDKEDVNKVWPLVMPLFEKVVPHTQGEYDIEDIALSLVQGHHELWVQFDEGVNFAVTTRIANYPNKTVLEIVWAGCRDNFSLMAKDFQSMLKQIEDWAIPQGVEMTTIVGRKGWGKFLPEYSTDYVIYGKDYG